jgi:hypothetical protein
MVQAFEGAKRPDRVVYAYLVALDERFRNDNAKVTGDAPAGLRKAAAAALQAADDDPKHELAAESMAAVIYAYLALDEATEATRLLHRFQKRHGAKNRESVSLAAAAVAAYFNDREQHGEALSALGRDTNPAQAKHPQVKILWHAERGRALFGTGQGGADREFRTVVQTWRTPDPKDPSRMVGRQEPAPMLGRERVVDAVGAAQFLLAEKQRSRADSLAPPKYRGPKNSDGVERFIQGPVASWAQQRQRAVMAAAAGYDKVLAIRPVPPPRWVVAASARTGQLWHDLAQAMTSIELPEELSADQAAFEKAMAGSAKPAHDNARQAFERCQKHAAAADIDDDYADTCRQALKGD